MMDFVLFLLFVFVVLISTSKYGCKAQDPFDKSYYQVWGGDHLSVSDEGHQVHLLLDEHSGAGFATKSEFGSGFFGMKLKVPDKNTTGVITSFYLTTVKPGQPAEGVDHFEFDIEFFGRNLSTNVFANDWGHKENQFNLWFDPTADFHKYEILWNQHQIVWFVDGEVVRVWKNLTQLGVIFPIVPMHVEASIWNASFTGSVDWSQAPFTAHYQGFNVNGCVYQSSNPQDCYSEISYYWNQQSYWQLNPTQQAQLSDHRKNHMYFDYCNDKSKAGPECPANQ